MIESTYGKMGNGTKFKLSSMFPGVLSKIKGMTAGKKVKDKGCLLPLNAYGNDWSDDHIHDISYNSYSISKDFHGHGNPPSPVRTFCKKVDSNVHVHARHSSSPPCPSPINIRFPMESPIRRMKSRPVSPPRRSVNSTCSMDSPSLAPPLVVRAVPPRQRHNRFNSVDTHSDSESESSQLQSARAHLRLRTMSLQLDGSGVTDWDRERESHDQREWSEPELEAYGWSSGRRKHLTNSFASSSNNCNNLVNDMIAGEPSPIHTVLRCMPPNTPSEFGGNYSSRSDPRDLDHRSACPDFSSRELSSIDRSTVSLQFPDRNSKFTSLSSDDDNFFKVQRTRSTVIDRGINFEFGGLREEMNDHDYGTTTTDESEHVLTEDEERSRFGRHSALLAKTVRSWSTASNSWGRAHGQSRFAEEKHQNQQQEKTILSYGTGRSKEFDGSDDFVGKKKKEEKEEEEEEERHHYHVALSRREASLVKTVLSAKDWARTNLRALSKARDLEKQQQQHDDRETGSMVEYEPLGMRVIRKEEHRHQSRGRSTKSTTLSPVGEVEKHTKGRIDYKLAIHDSDSSVYDHFSRPRAEDLYEIDFYKNAHTEESDLESNPAAVPRFREVEFPSFRSDRGGIGRRPDFVNALEPDGLASRSHRFSIQQDRSRSSRNPRKQTPLVTSFTSKSGREISGRKSNRSASPGGGGVHDVSPVNKPSPRRHVQELHGGKRMSSGSPRAPSAREEVVSSNSKKVGRPPSPKRQDVISGRKASSVSSFPGGQQKQQHHQHHQQQQQEAEVKSSKKGSGRSEPRPDKSEKKMGTGADNTRPVATSHEDRTTVMGSESVAVVKASFDPYQDFRDSMVEMILDNDIQTAGDLEELLQCYLSLNSSEYHSIIVQVFSDIWRDIFDH